MKAGTPTDPSAQHRVELADRLAHLTTPAVEAAFRTVPRHEFTPRFAIHDLATRKFTEHDVHDPDPSGRCAALAAVYSDDTLITRMDSDGTPISSSTEPSLMAMMLTALDLQPGHRVLEIGTGTGYNAGLLSALQGDTSVTTIDIDPELTTAAEAALARAGHHPTVLCGDGADGAPDHAPYDRIIATCGVDRVPTSWREQLAPGGAILVNISKGITLLRHDQHANLSGRFLGPAGFMSLRSPGDPRRPTPAAVIAATDQPTAVQHLAKVPVDLDYGLTAFFTCLIAPHSRLVFTSDDQHRWTSYRWHDPHTGSWARVDLHSDGARLSQAGPRHLWLELEPVLDTWLAAGRPPLTRYGLTITDRHALWLDHPANIVTSF